MISAQNEETSSHVSVIDPIHSAADQRKKWRPENVNSMLELGRIGKERCQLSMMDEVMICFFEGSST